jgi:hypothetical protein
VVSIDSGRPIRLGRNASTAPHNLSSAAEGPAQKSAIKIADHAGSDRVICHRPLTAKVSEKKVNH